MQTRKTIGLFIVAATLLLAACARKDAQQSFSSPEAAFEALVVAASKDDVPAMSALLGNGAAELLDSGDPVQDKLDRAAFVTAYRDKHSLDSPDANTRTLIFGNNDSVGPIPAVKRDGQWVLDGNAGADELVYRRVGANELGAIGVMEGYVDAQNEYAAKGHDGDPPGIYAMKLVSDAGLENGLYWQTVEGEEPSPAGEFVAAAASEGYRGSTSGPTYHGYRFRMLYRQGEHANGGARDYFVNGVLSNGFGLVAWPADYGSSGVMTFIVNPDGVVFQKDLGEDTQNTVTAITSFDPDSTWTAIADTDKK